MKTQLISLMAALSLVSLSTQALASDTTMRLDTRDCGVPEYKMEWQSEEETGDAVIAFKIDPSGKVKDVKLVESSGYPNLDSASVRAIKRCVFKNGVASTSASSNTAWESVKVSWILK
jgi:protein TonB